MCYRRPRVLAPRRPKKNVLFRSSKTISDHRRLTPLAKGEVARHGSNGPMPALPQSPELPRTQLLSTHAPRSTAPRCATPTLEASNSKSFWIAAPPSCTGYSEAAAWSGSPLPTVVWRNDHGVRSFFLRFSATAAGMSNHCTPHIHAKKNFIDY